jgi:hypothetical protein
MPAWTWSGEQIIYKQYFHVGVAVDSPRGLIVPVLRDVDRKSIRELAVDFQVLVARAREGKTSLEELQGGTFTITNAGAVGGGHFAPIINFPQVAILGMGRAVLKPVVRPDPNGEPEIVPRLMMPLVLSFDHRIADARGGHSPDADHGGHPGRSGRDGVEFLSGFCFGSKLGTSGGGSGRVLPIRYDPPDCSFSSTWKKTNQKKTPVPRFLLRVAAAVGARGNSPAFRRAQTVRALFPVRRVDARRGTKGIRLTAEHSLPPCSGISETIHDA